MSLDRSLVLNRYLNSLFGADQFEDLRVVLKDQDEGPGPDGHSRFFHVLVGRKGLRVARESLVEYDSRIVAYESKLASTRTVEPFQTFKYFQFLALLYSEVFLDRLTTDPQGFVDDLNAFREADEDYCLIPPFESDDLRRLAFFMATGSGKTLLLHVNILQILHYLETGKHADMLVRRPDGRKEFDNVLLITPGEGLSEQHLLELEDSGFYEASRFSRNATGGLFGPRVQVIEITKLSDEPSGEGVSVPVADLGKRNLVIVDEGHKGTGSEAKAWKTRQKFLSEDGFLLEYSATFAQAIGAAGKVVRRELLAEYGKAIIFDYSYRYFYGDGYGKAFRVLNLKKATAPKAHEIMLGGLLVFYQQLMLYRTKGEDLRSYNIEKPLWVLLGTSVSRKRPNEKDVTLTAEEERTDVAELVAFIRRVLEDPVWAVNHIGKILSGNSGFSEASSGNDLFGSHVGHLKGENAEELYRRLCAEVFHGQGGLEVREIKRSGEIGLRVSAGSQDGLPYFAIINIGDVPAFKKHLQDTLKIQVSDDVINDSAFERISVANSPINMLIGAKKFIEGWSSWRVSSMGLLRIGKGEGSQVIQLFGRGVRLKGKEKSLKRSHTLPTAPKWLESLETLYIVGWNADYLQTFRDMLDREDLAKELPPLRVQQKDLPEWLALPQLPTGYDSSADTWELNTDGPRVIIDLRPQVVTVRPGTEEARIESGHSGNSVGVTFSSSPYLELADADWLYADLATYKARKGYSNVFIRRDRLRSVLSRCEARMLVEEARDPSKVRQAASRALKTYLDRFVRMRERQAESAHAVPGPVLSERQVVGEYRITVQDDGAGQQLLTDIETLLQQPLTALLGDGPEPLPRLYLDWHIFNPILVDGGKVWKQHVRVAPPALVPSERTLVQDLRAFWEQFHNSPQYQDCEVCLLRNLPKVGAGIFVRSGFYPDFILWIWNRKTEAVRVVFLDPHGLHHEGVVSNDRFAAIEKLRALGSEARFKSKSITLDGYILAPAETPPGDIPGAEEMTWEELEAAFPLLRQEGPYVEEIFGRD